MTEHSDGVIVAALEDRADRGLARGAEAVVAAAWRQHDRTNVGDPRFGRRRARGVWLATAAAVVIVMVLLARSMPAPDADVPGTTTTSFVWEPVGSMELPTNSTNSNAPTVWTGTEAVLVGGLAALQPDGSRRMAESAAFDPATGRMRLIAAPPVLLRDEVLGAVWTGREILVLATEWLPRDDRSVGPVRGVAYDPARDTWRTLPEAPAVIGMVRADDRVLGWTESTMVAYDPATDRWSEHGPSFAALDPVGGRFRGPVAWGRGQLASVGERVAVFTPGADTMTFPEPIPPVRVTFAAATDTTLVMYSQGPDRLSRVTTWDLSTATGFTGQAAPAGRTASVQRIAWVNGQVVTWNDRVVDAGGNLDDREGGSAYSSVTNSWSPVPHLPGQPATIFSGIGVNDRLFTWAVDSRPSFGVPTLSAFSMTVN